MRLNIKNKTHVSPSPPKPHPRVKHILHNLRTLFPPRTRSTFPLLHLPNELLLIIAESLSATDLFNLLLANRRLSSLLQNTLYGLLPTHDTTPKGLQKSAHILRTAVRNGHDRLLAALLSQGVPIPAPPSWDDSLLNLAARSGSTTVARQVLPLAEPPFPGETGITPLHVAILRLDVEMVKVLLEHGVEVHSHSTIEIMGMRYAAIHYAAQWGSRRVVEVLLKYGADPNDRTGDVVGMTPLQVVLLRGPRVPDEVVRVLIGGGASVGVADWRGRSVMHFAVLNVAHVRLRAEKTEVERRAAGKASHRRVLELVKRLGGGVDERDVAGWTPLHVLVDGMLDAGPYCENLVEMGADVGALTGDGATALHVAVRAHAFASPFLVETCGVLVGAGVDRDARDGEGRSALDIAKGWGLGRRPGRTKDAERLLRVLGEPDEGLFGRFRRGKRDA